MLTVSNITVTSTNANYRQSNYVRAYRDGKKIADVSPTSMYGPLNYLKKHPKSKYTVDFRSQLENNGVESWIIDTILS